MIKLSDNTFRIIPEGKTIFKIMEVDYDSDFGKMEIKMATSEGLKHSECFRLISKVDGSANEPALRAFSFFARQAMNDSNLSEIDEQAMVGHFIEATVEHTKQPNRNDPTKTVTFIKLTNYNPANGFAGSAKSEKKVDIDF